MPLPSVYNQRDEGNLWLLRAGPVAVLILLPLVIFFQQFTTSLRGQTLTKPLSVMAASEEVRDPGVGELTIESKFIVKSVYQAMMEFDPSGAAARRPYDQEQFWSETVDEEDEPTTPTGLMEVIDGVAISRVDRFRAAIVAGELLGPKAAHERLEALKVEAEPGGSLASEIGWLSPWYEHASAHEPDVLAADFEAALLSRHGWFAELAIAHQRHSSDPTRWGVVTGAESVEGLYAILVIAGVLTFVLGLILAFVLFAMARGGIVESNFYETRIDRRLYLEVFALFLLGFLVLDVAGIVVIGERSGWAFALTEVLMWGISASALWPLLRGASWGDLTVDLGLNTGRGVFREIGIGVVGYIAAMPLIIIGVIITGLVMSIFQGEPPPEEVQRFPMFESPLSDSWIGVILSTISACVWAPIVEEVLFRGALHRFLPGGFGVLGRTLVSAAVFGMVHPYDAQGMITVGFAGIAFGLMREWRGTLIPSMVAHAIHNGVISFVQIGTLVLLG
jgi:membrane protease YdiL (CAAX protease family)